MTIGIRIDESRLSCTSSYHDTYSAYCYGCRCVDAREDKRLYYKRQREGRGEVRRVDALPVRRRLQALGVIGWSSVELGRRLGMGYVQLSALRSTRRFVMRSTIYAVTELYSELWMTPGPSDVTREYARSVGWIGPLGWDNIDDPYEVPWIPSRDEQDLVRSRVDDVVVERVLLGEDLPMSMAERIEVTRVLSSRGWSEREIAERTGATDRTIHRDRCRLGLVDKGMADAVGEAG